MSRKSLKIFAYEDVIAAVTFKTMRGKGNCTVTQKIVKDVD